MRRYIQEAAINPSALSAAASEVFGNGALAGVVGWCRLKVSHSAMKAPMVLALEIII